MRVLELRAVDLDRGARVAEERLRHGFDHSGLPRAGGPQEEEVADRSSRRVQPGQKHLIDFDYLFNGLILANDLATKCAFKVPRVTATAGEGRRGGWRGTPYS